jgi:hypothetical protein
MIYFVKRKPFWIAFLLIVFLFFITFKPQTKADLVYFYPQTCLGSFVNPEKAQGEREVNSPDLINELNSAVYYSGFKEIYCGNFQGPIKEGEVKKVTLHFNWIITKELREKPIIESTSPESLIEKIIPSRTIEINVGTSDVQILENTTNSNESNNTNTNSNELQTATSSQIFKFINFVFAQEETRNNTNNEETQNNTKTNETLANTNTDEINTNSNEVNQTNTNESQTATSSYENINKSEQSVSSPNQSSNNQSEESVLSPNQSASKTLFDIYYTLDGQNWNYLGSVNENNWQNLSFDIPVAEVSLRYGASPVVEKSHFGTRSQSEDITRLEVSSALLQGWLDISKIQIKINSLPDTDYYLYLESMWLEVEYISKNKEIVEEEKDIYGVYLAKIDLTKEEFTLEEIPEISVFVFEKDKENILNHNITTDKVSASNQNIIEEPIVIDEKLKIKLKVLNSKNEVIYKTDNYIYDKENNRLIFNLNDFNFYPEEYIIKVYVNNFLAGEVKFKISGEIIKKEFIDSNQYIVFLKNKEKHQIWYLEQNQNNSWEKIYEGDFIPPYAISDKYFLYVLGNALYGYSLESKTYFSQSLEPDYSTIISVNGRNFKVKYYQNSLILNEIFQNEENQNF